jgi:hypothetical protein
VTLITANSLTTSIGGPLTSVCSLTYSLYPHLALLVALP